MGKTSTSGRPAALLDRDGAVIRDRHYLSDPDQVELLPGAAEGLKRMSGLGLALVLVSNQSGVGRGYFSTDAVNAVNRRLAELLAAEGVALDGVYYCPHGPNDGCDCRKPAPGLALQAAADLGLDLARSFVIGDKCSDVKLGLAVQACPILVRTGYGAQHEPNCADLAAAVVDDMAAAAEFVAGCLAEAGRRA